MKLRFSSLAIFVLLIAACLTNADSIDSALESSAYALLERGLIETGTSPNVAECVVKILKWQGATNDVMDIRNIIEPQKLAEKLKQKSDNAQFICTYGGPVIVFFVFLILFICCVKCCICCCRFCCGSSKPQIIQIITQREVGERSNVPYSRMEQVEV